jgi:hypothetical protein
LARAEVRAQKQGGVIPGVASGCASRLQERAVPRRRPRRLLRALGRQLTWIKIAATRAVDDVTCRGAREGATI